MRAEDLPSILDHGLADFVLIIDDAGVVLWAGGDAEGTIGVEAATLIGRSAADILANPDKTAGWRGPRIGDETFTGWRQAAVHAADGSHRQCEIRVRFARGGLRVATVRLLTREVAGSRSGKPRLIGHDAVHELQNLLGVVIGFTDVLLASIPKDSELESDLREISAAALAANRRLQSE